VMCRNLSDNGNGLIQSPFHIIGASYVHFQHARRSLLGTAGSDVIVTTPFQNETQPQSDCRAPQPGSAAVAVLRQDPSGTGYQRVVQAYGAAR
jgi:hypothetical protein